MSSKFLDLGKIADVDISGVDKKTKDNEHAVKLCNFVDVYYNWAVSKETAKKFILASANQNEIERFTVKKGQVAITKDSETREDIGVSTYIADELENTLLGYHCALIKPYKNVLDGKYLNAFLHTQYTQKHFSFKAGGSGQRYTLTVDAINSLKVPVLPIKEQEKIGDFFSYIDRKIENNNKINVELESMTKAIYDYWFLQFDFPDENEKPYKSSGRKMVWNEELKRQIPEGWRVGTLEEIANITMGSSPKGESLNKEKDGMIFYQGKTDFGYRFPTVRMYTNSPIRYAEANDILLSVRAPVGDMNIADEKCCIGRGLAAIRSKYQSFLFYLMLSNQFQFDKYNNGGTTFGAITKDDLFGLRIIIPDEKLMDLFNSKASTFDKMIFNNEKVSKELTSLRDFLLPLLMNGQVKFTVDG